MTFIKGLGTTLSHSPAGTTYTVIAQLKDVSFGWEVGTVETTNLSSSSKEYLETIPGGSELSATIQYDPDEATHQTLTGLINSPATAFWKVTTTDATPATYSFAGILTKFDISGMESESVVEASISIQPTGALTIA